MSTNRILEVLRLFALQFGDAEHRIVTDCGAALLLGCDFDLVQ
jgi:hypothetical protein